MRSLLYLALGAFAGLAAAQRDNSFNNPPGGFEFEAGEPTTLTWDATTDGTVTIKLQKGDNITPDSGIIIADGIANSGSVSFVPPANLGPGSDYTIQIIDDSNPDNYNFTPPFSVDGTTGTQTGLPTSMSTEMPTSSEPTSGTTTTASSSETSSSTESSETTMTTGSSATTSSEPTTTSDATTTTSPTGTSTGAPSPEDGAKSLGVPGGLLSAMLAVMALL